MSDAMGPAVYSHWPEVAGGLYGLGTNTVAPLRRLGAYCIVAASVLKGELRGTFPGLKVIQGLLDIGSKRTLRAGEPGIVR